MQNNQQTRSQLLEAAQQTFRAHGLPFTFQRRAVLEVLLGRDDHPTADDLYQELQASNPGLSRTTVYRILETFSRFGLIRRLSHAGGSVRWDRRVDRHHHAECVACGDVIDFEDGDLDRLSVPRSLPSGFETQDYSVHFLGVCATCRATTATDSH